MKIYYNTCSVDYKLFSTLSVLHLYKSNVALGDVYHTQLRSAKGA